MPLLLVEILILLIISIFIGIIASMLGIGGGIFLIPILTLGFGVDIKVAAATSLVTIIVTSSTSASRCLREGFVNINLGVFLEFFSVIGAITGAVIAYYLDATIIEIVFAGVLVYTAIYMWRTRDIDLKTCTESTVGSVPSRFRAKFHDECTDKQIEYDVKHVPRGAGASFAAGNLSGLVGVGGGTVNVPSMNIWMGVPMKAAISTSNFMIGVTAVASALVYLSNGFMAPIITAAAAIGIFIGAMLGTGFIPKIKGNTLRMVFVVTIIVIAVLMILRAGGWWP